MVGGVLYDRGMTAYWADVADVLKYTTKTVVIGDVERAEAEIEDVVGVLADPALRPGVVISPRDLHFLKKAVAYQAGWSVSQPDAYERSEVASISQDGASATFTDGSLTLAPFARRALRRLSWRGTRSVVINSAALVVEPDDEDLHWTPLS